MDASDPLLVGVAFLAAFAVVLLMGPFAIEKLRVLKFGQNINADAPGRHAAKQGTPTMGGALIVLGVLIGLLAVCLILLRSHAHIGGMSGPAAALIAVLLVFLGNALLGFIDDYMSIKRGRSLGLKARYKLLGQLIIAVCFAAWLSIWPPTANTTVIHIGDIRLNLGLGYYVLAVLWIIGVSNATNFTDGLDGLLSGTAILATLGVTLAIVLDSTALGTVTYLHWFGSSLIGACLGFLWYNAHPAKVFMGDTGSLAIGAALAAMAIVSKHEILVLVFGLVFVVEIVSVMIQVTVFKATGGKPNGRRVFKMTPIHHHFELSGVAETAVVIRFWIFGVLALAAGLILAANEML